MARELLGAAQRVLARAFLAGARRDVPITEGAGATGFRSRSWKIRQRLGGVLFWAWHRRAPTTAAAPPMIKVARSYFFAGAAAGGAEAGGFGAEAAGLAGGVAALAPATGLLLS